MRVDNSVDDIDARVPCVHFLVDFDFAKRVLRFFALTMDHDISAFRWS